MEIHDDFSLSFGVSEFISEVLSGSYNEHDGTAHYEDAYGMFLGWFDWTGFTEPPKKAIRIIWEPK